MSAPYTLIPNAFNPDMDKILAEIELVEYTSARREAFHSVTPFAYTYGQGMGRRTYHSKPLTPFLEELRQGIDVLGSLDLCFINHYADERQHLGWHADDSPEQDPAAPIAVLSFGASRQIWVRENGSDRVDRITLEPGSVFIMNPGMQETHQHRIPKHDRPCGPRLSLTWRRSLNGHA